jgi:glyceraldehyde 3-phosphate dehydrogenase
VPTPNVSLVDLTVTLEKDVTKEEVNNVLKEASENSLKGILKFETEELVSIDFKGSAHSSIFDSSLTKVMDKRMIKVFAWYDNEWGYSCRVAELVGKVI